MNQMHDLFSVIQDALQRHAVKLDRQLIILHSAQNNDAAAALSQKEIDRQKLQAARRRDAEKYGDYPECSQAPEEDKKKKK